MTRLAMLPLLVLGACSPEVDNSEAELANQGERLAVENVVIVQNDPAPVENGIVAQDPVPETAAEAAVPAAPAAAPPATRTAPAQPKREAPAPEPKASAKVASELPKEEPKPAATTCTDEHREMGHC